MAVKPFRLFLAFGSCRGGEKVVRLGAEVLAIFGATGLDAFLVWPRWGRFWMHPGFYWLLLTFNLAFVPFDYSRIGGSPNSPKTGKKAKIRQFCAFLGVFPSFANFGGRNFHRPKNYGPWGWPQKENQGFLAIFGHFWPFLGLLADFWQNRLL